MQKLFTETSKGFTLVELMVTIAIAGVLVGIAIPSFTSIISNNRLTTSANELVTALNLARSEAVKRGVSVTVRKIDDKSSTNKNKTAWASANWEQGWDVFTDANDNGEFDTGDDVLLKTYAALSASYTLRGNNFANFIRFTSSGQSNTNGSFVICNNSDGNNTPEANTSRLIIVNSIGRVRMGLDANNDGIPNTDTVASTASNITSCLPPF
ncbi:prepilin-type N-terminal cleavage/methylation domain-containing protein [Methylomonas sp. LW13]|uniref:GspH/FimT family pseudopilin n=1 Tax=unclassified Methylomonas TaxID=2608980 RepID=UPI0009FE2500|nr:Tfp pilus assembly protein FimT/FimU [Methylomonas sp. LW13]QBC26943.1 prepilin-type N-terminal cleavage/methylation domain-containing protein [Methylomonas sp. LW13]